MKEIIVNTTKDFDKEFGWINYKEFVRKALIKTQFKKDYKLYNVTLIDAEPSKRVYFTNEDNSKEFFIKYDILYQDDKKWKAFFVIYVDEEINGEIHSVQFGGGEVVTSYKIN